MPVPPNNILTTTTANAADRTGTYHGTEAESVSASRSPVTTEEQSNDLTISPTLFFMHKRKIPSDSTALTTESAITSAARQPKYTMPATAAGSSAITTSSMIFRVLLPHLTCGELDTTCSIRLLLFLL